MEYLDDKLKDNKNARAMILLIEESKNRTPDIVLSIQKQLKSKRVISSKQFKILKDNLPD